METLPGSHPLELYVRRYSIPLSLVVEAKAAFDAYRSLDLPAQGEDVASTTAAAAAPAEKGEELLGVAGLQAFLGDTGIRRTRVEVAALVEAMTAMPVEVSRLHEQELLAQQQQQQLDEQRMSTDMVPASAPLSGRGSIAGALGDAADGSAATVPTPRATPGVYATRSTTGLAFTDFLQLMLDPALSADGGDPVGHRERELRAVFHRLDADGDGVLTERDIRLALTRLLVVSDAGESEAGCRSPVSLASPRRKLRESALASNGDLVRLAAMHPVEVRAALSECDANADGVVTVEDFLTVMHS